MDKSFFSGSDFDKRSEAHKSCNLTAVNRADFRVIGDKLNY